MVYSKLVSSDCKILALSASPFNFSTKNLISFKCNPLATPLIISSFADFNGDGISDIFLAAHNESPTIGASSTVYLSDKAGSYNKLVLGDSVTAHQPNLVYVNGIPTVFVSPFSRRRVVCFFEFIDAFEYSFL